MAKIDDPDLNLLIAGRSHTKSYHKKLIRLSEQLSISDKVIFLGGVSKEELRDLYSSCEIFIFTSPFENFAYTLIEAMSCGAAVIAANSTAMPETCNSAALYFNPYSSEELIELINRLLSDRVLIEEYKSRSITRSSQINNYKEANSKTYDIINDLIVSG